MTPPRVKLPTGKHFQISLTLFPKITLKDRLGFLFGGCGRGVGRGVRVPSDDVVEVGFKNFVGEFEFVLGDDHKHPSTTEIAEVANDMLPYRKPTLLKIL